jgi:hypothetical protein
MRTVRRVTMACAAVAAVLLAPRSGEVHTWYVKADSTGDAPTIWAAVESTLAGDTVLVGPGTYVFTGGVWIKRPVVVRSEAGPLETRIESAVPPYYPNGAFYVDGVTPGRTEISGFWFDGFRWIVDDGGVIGIHLSDSVYVNHNVFTNHNAAGVSFTISDSYWVIIENNTFVSGTYAIENHGSLGFVSYNIMWSHSWGLGSFWTVLCNCMLDVDDAGVFALYNFQADPEFCGTIESQNLFLQSDSPCAPGNAPLPSHACDTLRVIGALPVGCGTAPTKRRSWGEIKRIYR